MEEKQIQMKRAHRLTMAGRRCAAITGVSEVLQTEDGLLMIKGEELHVSRLTLEKGEVDLDGKIDSLTYTGSQGKKADRNGSRFKRMFQ